MSTPPKPSGTEGFVIDENGRKTDTPFWDDLLGDDTLPTDFDYLDDSTEEPTPTIPLKE
jgi:hypothetical protein